MAADSGDGAFCPADRISASAAGDSGPSSTSATIGSLSSSAIIGVVVPKRNEVHSANHCCIPRVPRDLPFL